nr:cation diffusion facilitator family transporter [Profundibacterium mesophilum]
MRPEDARRDNRRAILASVAVALVLVGAKLWAFAATGALSVAASLADSALDLIVSLGGLTAVIYAARPPDEDHAFGHGSVEDLAALGQSLFIAVSAIVIAASGIAHLVSGRASPLSAEGPGIAVMSLSIVLTLGLVSYQGRIARRTQNRVVSADRLHYIGDLLPNIGAVAALGASAAFGIVAIDAIVAIAAALVLLTGAWRIGIGAWDALMDKAADPETVAGIERIASEAPGVHGFHDLKTRRAGSRVFVNLHIELDGAQSLSDAHEVGAELHRAILRHYPQCEVIIHKDPLRPGRRAARRQDPSGGRGEAGGRERPSAPGPISER